MNIKDRNFTIKNEVVKYYLSILILLNRVCNKTYSSFISIVCKHPSFFKPSDKHSAEYPVYV